MFKRVAALAVLAALPAHAETLSAELGRAGLAATETRLAALPTLKDEERLALGMVQFLHAIEGTFQTRWTYGMTDRSGMLPLLRLPLDDNPAPKAFEAGVIATLFREAEAGLATSIATLEAVPEGTAAGLEINLADLWFDVNASTTRDPGEGLIDILNAAAFQTAEAAPALPSIRFDAADAAWAAAYGHLLSGFSELVLAYDPTEPITRILNARQVMAEWGPPNPSMIFGGQKLPDEIDMLAMVFATLNQQPDKPRMLAAEAHFLAMIENNRRFWARVDAETDNDREWLPNARQVSGMGVALPPETGQVWQAVLADAEALLKGEKLIPYWRTGDAGGINLHLLFTDPRPVDVPGWFQGWAALPYLQSGPLVSGESWSRFEAMMTGDAMLFALWFN